ncbi:MAG: DUF1592 domain-containing protein [Polyangiaceae bacterium]|nr:DUF1592 domain-containing protein [Polyangiaceae bacterium]
MKASQQYLLVVAGMLGAIAMAPGCSDDDGTGGNGGGEGGGGGGSSFQVVPAPGGVRRITGSQMRYSLEYLLGAQAASDFEVWGDPQLHGFESIAAAELAIGANDVSTLETEVTAAVTTSLQDVSTLATFAPCVQNAPSAACYEEVATQFGRVAWRRPVEADEKERLVNIANMGQTWGAGDFDVGLKYELMAIFQSPNFVYVSEIGEGEGSDRPLTAYELASRMSFFLVHRTPDVELLDAVEAGKLATDDGIREEARRMLLMPEARRSLDRFFSELYLIRDITTISKDQTIYPQWNEALARTMQEEMLRFLQDVVWTRDADAREIFTSESTFVNATLAAFYGVTAPSSGWTKVEIPADQGRFGLLGKAGFLARFADVKRTSPTRRGRFYREKILCREIPPPPPGVDTSLPEPQENQTMRQRLTAHREDPNCAGCHSLIDPIGLAYEHFDTLGQYRDTEDGLEIITADKSGDLEFAGPADLATIASDGAAGCLVKNFWRQSTGHLETEGEEDALGRLESSFADNGYSLQEMMVELTVSQAFKRVGDPK